MNPITYDRILKARMLKASEEASMDEKNKYCQKHFGCNYSECTPKQKAQCNRECGKDVSKADMSEKNTYCQKHFNRNYSECTDKQKAQCDRECGKVSKGDYYSDDSEEPKKKKKGSLPDHSGDGKITQADRLMAIGVIDKPSDTKKSDDKAYKNMNCMDCSDGVDSEGKPCCDPKDTKKSVVSIHEANDVGWSVIKAEPCTARGCGATAGDGPEACLAGQHPATCQRRRASARHSRKALFRGGRKMKHLGIDDEY